jgi:hypothetical protein
MSCSTAPPLCGARRRHGGGWRHRSWSAGLARTGGTSCLRLRPLGSDVTGLMMTARDICDTLRGSKLCGVPPCPSVLFLMAKFSNKSTSIL